MDNPKRRCENDTERTALSEAPDPKQGPHFLVYQCKVEQAFLPVFFPKGEERGDRQRCLAHQLQLLEIETGRPEGWLDSPDHGNRRLPEKVLDLRPAQTRGVVFK
jgi:hypothetical protein